MICSKCGKEKQPEEFGLRGGVRFKQCKRCCTMAKNAKTKLNESRNQKPTVVAGWPWKFTGKGVGYEASVS